MGTRRGEKSHLPGEKVKLALAFSTNIQSQKTIVNCTISVKFGSKEG